MFTKLFDPQGLGPFTILAFLLAYGAVSCCLVLFVRAGSLRLLRFTRPTWDVWVYCGIVWPAVVLTAVRAVLRFLDLPAWFLLLEAATSRWAYSALNFAIILLATSSTVCLLFSRDKRLRLLVMRDVCVYSVFGVAMSMAGVMAFEQAETYRFWMEGYSRTFMVESATVIYVVYVCGLCALLGLVALQMGGIWAQKRRTQSPKPRKSVWEWFALLGMNSPWWPYYNFPIQPDDETKND